jgi:hypothetical protein
MRRFRNRKGVFVVLFGILFTVLMAAGAIAIDFSRIWAMRNELQTAADAAALSGAVQLNKPPKNLLLRRRHRCAGGLPRRTWRWALRRLSIVSCGGSGRITRRRRTSTPGWYRRTPSRPG